MKQKELRLALVCYGGVSLAVYMHGMTKEIWKLLRASRHHAAFQAANRASEAMADPQRSTSRARESNAQRAAPVGQTDSETHYHHLLELIGEHMELRVLCDVIAGASAGGINGIFLAQAIARDQSLDPLTSLWLNNADVEQLLDPDAASTRFSKVYMWPVLWAFGRWQARKVERMLGDDAPADLRRKLSRFVRSRWFSPPFSGPGLTRMLFDGLKAMDAETRRDVAATEKDMGMGRTLLPPRYPLDLFVTVTDYDGYAQTLSLHSPPTIVEREHRLVISFNDPGHGDGHRQLGDLASLAFAARATSSFPGAFPPVQIAEVDSVVGTGDGAWPDRSAFLKRVFPQAFATGTLEDIALIDGSVLNNKPFAEAIRALNGRPAFREVDRRIVYIEPKPAITPAGAETPSPGKRRRGGRPPGFFSTLLASLSTIPRKQPIRDDLEWVQEITRRAARTSSVVAAMSGEVAQAVAEALRDHVQPDARSSQVSALQLAAWRHVAHEEAAQRSGYTYGAYIELKIAHVLEAIGRTLWSLSMAAGASVDAPHADPQSSLTQIMARVKAWAADTRITPVERMTASPESSADPAGEPAAGAGDAALPAWLTFLKRFDLGFRIRRIQFVIRALNTLYLSADAEDSEGRMARRSAEVDSAKSTLYATVNALMARRETSHFSDQLKSACMTLSGEACHRAIDALAAELGLLHLDRDTDEAILTCLNATRDPAVYMELLNAYLGFPFFDVATLAMLDGDQPYAFEQIKVDRLSPQDCSAFASQSGTTPLKGIEFATFGAFFSRAYRENDYLWGRLHAAERLVEIVASAATGAARLSPERLAEVRTGLLRAILLDERPRLKTATALIDSLLEALKSAGDKLS